VGMFAWISSLIAVASGFSLHIWVTYNPTALLAVVLIAAGISAVLGVAAAFFAKRRIAVSKVALQWAKANRWAIEGALKEAVSLIGAARLLNERGVATPSGGSWYASSVKNVAGRLGLLK
jgi:hypothetical protein